MVQRINPDTGYPMSTDKQIKQAKDLLYLSKPHLTDEEILQQLENPGFSKIQKLQFCISTLTSPYEYKADYFYKIGDYDEAEKNYLEIFYLNYNFANKLRILYQREKRYKDAAYITEFAHSVLADFENVLCNINQLEKIKHDVSSASQKALNHSIDDKSIIDGESQIWLTQRAEKKLELISKWSDEIDNIPSDLDQELSDASTKITDTVNSASEPRPYTPHPTTQRTRSTKSNNNKKDIGCGTSIILLFTGAILGQLVAGNIGGTIGVIIVGIIIIISILS